MKIGKREMRERIKHWLVDLANLETEKKLILFDLCEILYGKTYDQVCKEIGEMSKRQVINCNYHLLTELMGIRE